MVLLSDIELSTATAHDTAPTLFIRNGTTTNMLTHDQCEQFHQQGYLVLQDLLDLEDIDRICTEITQICDNPDQHADELIQLEPKVLDGSFKPERLEFGVRKLFKVVKNNVFFCEIAKRTLWTQIARELIGDDIAVLQSMLMMKPPECSGVKIWHQDNAYFRVSPPDIVGFWVACDEATVENGCMHIVPGSHRGGIVEHAGDGDNYGMTASPDAVDVVAVPLKPGEALIFHGELFHYTPPNTTNKRRRALQYHYASTHTETDPSHWFQPDVELVL